MYVETDFLLALVTEDDWLGVTADAVYREHRDDLWTSPFALLELLMVAFREDLDVERVVVDAADLLEVRGDAEPVVAAASYVEDHGVPPFDALHLVESAGETILTQDETYEPFAPVFHPSPDGGG